MNQETVEQFRRTLLARRDALKHRWRRALSEEDEILAEREPDWEDTAAARTVVLVLESISELERGALARIQSALSRIERGTYGDCVVCHEPIGEDRLSAVPDTDRCGGCATAVN